MAKRLSNEIFFAQTDDGGTVRKGVGDDQKTWFFRSAATALFALARERKTEEFAAVRGPKEFHLSRCDGGFSKELQCRVDSRLDSAWAPRIGPGKAQVRLAVVQLTKTATPGGVDNRARRRNDLA